MKRLAALAALALASTISALPAAAREYVQDQAGMFSAGTVAALNTRIAGFNAQTGKEIVVVTVPSLAGATLPDAANGAFAQRNVNGVLVFIARDERRDIIVPDRAGVQAGWFTPDVLRSVRASMESQFRSEDYDAGVTTGVDGILNVYRAHLGNLRHPSSNSAGAPMTSPSLPSTGGFHISMFWWIIIIVVGFLILRSVMRSLSGPRYGAPGMPPSGPGGVPPAGYGAGYGGGGSFWSGLLGGLGGAWLGNEMFGQHGGGGGALGPADAGQAGTPDAGGGWGGNAGGDAGAGWQSDAGQADTSGASGGDWSGGGFGGDGGGGDSGGGGGDSGGGW
ncbi:MAG: TPM domain-containing protein [Candidatus Tumulicola sp.]